MKTFEDLYTKIQTLDNVEGQGKGGVHRIDEMWAFQLYADKRQVNIGHYNRAAKAVDSWANFRFEPHAGEVTMYSCTSPGICDYSSGRKYNWDTKLDVPYPIKDGGVIRDLLISFVESEGY